MYRRRLVYLVVISSVIRLLLSLFLELGNDEVYYFTYALHLQSNYFDHPPAIAFLIRIFTFNLAFTSEVFIRLGPVICSAAGTLISYKIGSFIKDARTGWLAAIFYSTSIYCSIISGIFILPDSPQIVFWLISFLLLLVIINKLQSLRNVSLMIWILFGIANGLCIMCKIHGIFLWGGLGLYILFYKRAILLKPGLYLSFLITLLVIFPIFWWNYQNHFVTYNYHSSRVGTNHLKFDKDSFVQSILGQWFYNSPINVVMSIIGIVICLRRRLIENYYARIILLCGLPMIVVVTIMSMFNSVLPHWSGPGFLTLSFAGAVYINDFKSKKFIQPFPQIMKWMIAFIFFVFIAGIAVIKFYPGTIGSKRSDNFGENDFTLDIYGWKSFANKFDQYYNKGVESGNFKPGTKFICNKWFPAAHIDFYVAHSINSHVVGMGDINDLHHFQWLNEYRGSINNGEDAICIVPSNYPLDVHSVYGNLFSSIIQVRKFNQYRAGKLCRYFTIYLLKNFNAKNLISIKSNS